MALQKKVEKNTIPSRIGISVSSLSTKFSFMIGLEVNSPSSQNIFGTKNYLVKPSHQCLKCMNKVPQLYPLHYNYQQSIKQFFEQERRNIRASSKSHAHQSIFIIPQRTNPTKVKVTSDEFKSTSILCVFLDFFSRIFCISRKNGEKNSNSRNAITLII